MLDYVHSNALELIKEASLGGSRYFVNLIDYFNSKVWIYLFKKKFEVFTNIKLLKVKIENQVDKKISIYSLIVGQSILIQTFINFVHNMVLKGICLFERHLNRSL